MKLTLGQVADWIHAEGDFPDDAEVLGYSIDSRTIAAGELFFAVRGERFDGHDYVEAALANGAVAAVVSMRWLSAGRGTTRDGSCGFRITMAAVCSTACSSWRGRCAEAGEGACRGDRFGGQDDDEGGSSAGVECEVSRVEVAGQSE